MKAQATKPGKSRRWRPLSQSQLNAIECLLAGKTDTETASDPSVQVARQTIWAWKHDDLLFQSELQQRRASLWSAAHESLRGLIGKAIKNISASVEEGNIADSWLLLKAVNLFGNGEINAVPGCHLERSLEQRATNQANKEHSAIIDDRSGGGVLASLNFNVSQRTEEILEELMDEYSETEP